METRQTHTHTHTSTAHVNRTRQLVCKKHMGTRYTHTHIKHTHTHTSNTHTSNTHTSTHTSTTHVKLHMGTCGGNVETVHHWKQHGNSAVLEAAWGQCIIGIKKETAHH